ncbi:hypothetical protein K5T78_22750, partial [Escherichia coli]|nr:hypothetical protein [Escherichia coli]
KAPGEYGHVLVYREAAALLMSWWPAMFDGEQPRPMAVGMREWLRDEIAARRIPLFAPPETGPAQPCTLGKLSDGAAVWCQPL